MSYRVGDRVMIVSEWGRGCNQNPDGKMDHWLGQVMTIREVVGSGRYFMKEDREEWQGDGWTWNDNCIAGLAEPDSVFTKYKLRTGDLVETRNGRRYIFLRGVGDSQVDILQNVEEARFNYVTSYNSDLACESSEWDIMKVWRSNTCCVDFRDFEAGTTLVFDRSKKIMTLEAALKVLEEIVGGPVEVRREE